MIEQVREFMVAFGQPTEYDVVPAEVSQLRYDLIEEELKELCDAITIVEVADALTDLTYVILGAMIIYKVKPVHFPFITIDNLEICEETLAPAIAAIWGNIADWSTADDMDQLLNDLLVDVELMAANCGIPLQKCFDEVHRSNMSKLGEDGKPIYRADNKVLKGPNYSPPNLESILNV